MARRLRTAVGLAALLSLPAASAGASGFLVARFGGEQGHPTSAHPVALYFNPAGLSLRTCTRIYIEGLFAYRRASYERPAGAVDNELTAGEDGTGTPTEALSANSGEATLFDPAVVPFVGVVSDLGVPNLGVALGMYVPFGGSAVWDGNDEYEGDTAYPGAQDGVARWWAIEGQLRSMYVSAGGAYRIPAAKLSLGLSVSLVMNSVNSIRARTVNGHDDLVNRDANGQDVAEGRSWVDVKGTTFAVGAGAIYQPTPELSVGLSYQSQPGFGTTAQQGTLTNQFGNVSSTATEVDFEQALPDVIRLGGSYMVSPQLELRLFGEYVRWSVFTGQCLLVRSEANRKCALNDNGGLDTENGGAGVTQNVARYWDDAFGVRAGASWWANPDFEIWGGLGWDGNAVPDETMDPSLIDMPKLTIAAGLRYGLLDGKLHLLTNYLQVIYFSRTVDERPENDMGEPETFANLSRSPDGAGTYKSSVGGLTVGLEYGF